MKYPSTKQDREAAMEIEEFTFQQRNAETWVKERRMIYRCNNTD